MRGNLFERVAESVFIGGGRDNLVEDNKFIDTATAIHLDARGKTWQKEMTNSPSVLCANTWQRCAIINRPNCGGDPLRDIKSADGDALGRSQRTVMTAALKAAA